MLLKDKLIPFQTQSQYIHCHRYVQLYANQRAETIQAIKLCLEYAKQERLVISGSFAIDMMLQNLQNCQQVVILVNDRKIHTKTIINMLQSRFPCDSVQYDAYRQINKKVVSIVLHRVPVVDIIKLDEEDIIKIKDIQTFNQFNIVSKPFMLFIMHNKLMDVGLVFDIKFTIKYQKYCEKLFNLLQLMQIDKWQYNAEIPETKPIKKQEQFCQKLMKMLNTNQIPILYGMSAFLFFQSNKKQLVSYTKDGVQCIDVIRPALVNMRKPHNLKCITHVQESAEIDGIKINIYENKMDVQFIQLLDGFSFSVVHLQELLLFCLNAYLQTKDPQLFSQYLDLINKYLFSAFKKSRYFSYNDEITILQPQLQQ